MRRWRTATASVALVLALSACGADEFGAGSTQTIDSVGGSAQRGDVLPDVDLVDFVSGEETSLTAIEGPAVLNLWATWCAPCRAEIPDFEEVHQARGDEVRFIGVNVGESSSQALEFLVEVGATYEQFSDPTGDVSVALRATSLPVTVVLAADGTVSRKHVGPLDQDGLNEAIDEALSR